MPLLEILNDIILQRRRGVVGVGVELRQIYRGAVVFRVLVKDFAAGDARDVPDVLVSSSSGSVLALASFAAPVASASAIAVSELLQIISSPADSAGFWARTGTQRAQPIATPAARRAEKAEMRFRPNGFLCRTVVTANHLVFLTET